MLKKLLLLLILIAISLEAALPPELDFPSSPSSDQSSRDRRKRSFNQVVKKEDSKRFEYFLKSFALPGLGEYQLGAKGAAYTFWTTEFLLVGSAIGLYYFSDLRKQDYQDYAQIYAGVNPNDKYEGFWISVGNYDNTYQYNLQKQQERNFDSRFLDAEDQWQWNSDEHRKKYSKIRVESENLKTLSYYTVGAVVLNHLISAINASNISSSLSVESEVEQDSKGQPVGKVNLNWNF